MRKVDVIVLGAGISGCTAAALLARKGYQVAIVSRDAGTAHHLPESWIYNLPPNIASLDKGEKISASLKKQSRCVFCSPDHQHAIEFSIKDSSEIRKGDVVWVDRNRLDNELLNIALEQGATLLPFSRIVDCQISATGVTLLSENQNQICELEASYIVDATGKTAFLSHHLNLPIDEKKLDARLSYFSHFELTSEIPDEMRVVYIEGGYLFCIPISSQRLSVGCVLAENFVKVDTSPEETFNLAISSSSYVSDLIARSTRLLPIIAAKNSQRVCLNPAGARYRLVGDAAAFLDPFFCPGIDFAFFSAEQAVETIEQQSVQKYETAIKQWLEESQSSVYERMEHSNWKSILRLFADPHLPLIVPLTLTQAFYQFKKERFSFKSSIDLARKAYEVASC